MGLTPYISNAELIAFPSGISWASIVTRGTDAASQAARNQEIFNICDRASSEADVLCNQVLRATLNTEEDVGPDFRLTCPPDGVARFALQRFPVVALLGGQVSGAQTFPPAWQTVPASAMRIEGSLLGQAGSSAPDPAAAGPTAALIAPGYVTWAQGRRGFRFQIQYINGWPHCGLLTAAVAGDTLVQVDDITGWVGVAGRIYDGAQTEPLTVVAANPGSALTVALTNGTPVTSLQLKSTLGLTAVGTVVTLNVNGSGTLQTATVVAGSGPTQLNIASFTPNQNYAIGTPVGPAGVQSGPGTLQVLPPVGGLLYPHTPTATQQVIVSAMPSVIQTAVILLACAQALVRGATATTVQTLPGVQTSAGSRGIDDFKLEAEALLAPFRRIL